MLVLRPRVDLHRKRRAGGLTACGARRPGGWGNPTHSVASGARAQLLDRVVPAVPCPSCLLMCRARGQTARGHDDESCRAPPACPWVNRTSGRKRRTASCVALTALVRVAAASLVGSAQAGYSCTSDSQCEYPSCNDRQCSSSSSSCLCEFRQWDDQGSYCVDGNWKAYCSSYGYCVSGTEPRNSAYTTLAPVCRMSCAHVRAVRRLF